MDKFDGDSKKYRHWLFELLVAIGQVDKELVADLNKILVKERQTGEIQSWKAEDDGISLDRYDKYSGELYGVLVSQTGSEARNILRGMADSGDSYNGYKGLLLLNKRFDSKTAASLLQSYLEVVHPDKLKGSSEVIAGIQKWERKVGELAQRYGEKRSDNLKMAILVGILPKDFQDMVFQNGVMGTGKICLL